MSNNKWDVPSMEMLNRPTPPIPQKSIADHLVGAGEIGAGLALALARRSPVRSVIASVGNMGLRKLAQDRISDNVLRKNPTSVNSSKDTIRKNDRLPDIDPIPDDYRTTKQKDSNLLNYLSPQYRDYRSNSEVTG